MISSETWRKPKELESLKPFQVSQSVPDSLVRSPISKGPTDGPLGSLNVFLRYAGFSHTPRGGRQGCVICTPSYTLTSGPPGCWAPFISTWSRQNHQISPYFSSRMYQEQSQVFVFCSFLHFACSDLKLNLQTQMFQENSVALPYNHTKLGKGYHVLWFKRKASTSSVLRVSVLSGFMSDLSHGQQTLYSPTQIHACKSFQHDPVFLSYPTNHWQQ